jgi:hypothetical protein
VGSEGDESLAERVKRERMREDNQPYEAEEAGGLVVQSIAADEEAQTAEE